MKEEIKQKIKLIKNGQVPQGYKKTKVGILPEDWEEVHFKNIFIEFNIYTENLDKFPLYSLTIENGITKKTDRYERSHLVKKENSYKILKPNYFAYNPMNSRLGAIARHKGNIDVSISGYYNIFTTILDSDLKFMDNYLISQNMLCYYNRVSTGSLIEKQRVHFSQFLDFKLSLPNSKERKKIADILTTQDKIIELKQKLIEEKEKQKKYLMQNLLTGKIRLKGFKDKWEKVKLKDILEEVKEINKNLYVNNILSISNKLGFVKQEQQFGKTVASKDLSKYKIIKNEYIAYNPSRINVGSIAIYNKIDEGIVSPMYVVLKTKKQLLNNFFMYFTNTNYFFQNMKMLLTGSVRDSLNFKNLCQIKINLPLLQEQNAIAQILSKADEEIELLQKELEQEKQKKKALMQLLLTGIVRV